MATVTVQNDNNVTVQLSPQPSINVTIDRGIEGPPGPEGPEGPQGDPGPAGQGVPTGGTTGQALVKKSNTNYDTEWQDQSGGVSSVNGQTGDVVLDAADVDAATTAQGTKADTALQPAAIGVTVQALLVSATNIKTINGSSLLGSGNLVISGGGAVDSVNGQIGVVVLDAADVGAATTAQGALADTALQPAAIGTTVQGYAANLTSWAGISTSAKQDTLTSGTTIKTVNSTSLLGAGDVAVQPTLVSGTNIKTINGASVLGSGDIVVGGAVNSVNGYTGTVVLTAADVGAANQSLVNLLLTGF